MSLIAIGIGVVAGFIIGIGATLFYIRWKMKSQIGAMQEQMENMMDMTQGMDQDIGDLKEDEKEEE